MIVVACRHFLLKFNLLRAGLFMKHATRKEHPGEVRLDLFVPCSRNQSQRCLPSAVAARRTRPSGIRAAAWTISRPLAPFGEKGRQVY